MDHKDFKGHLRSSAPAVISSHVEVMLPESVATLSVKEMNQGACVRPVFSLAHLWSVRTLLQILLERWLCEGSDIQYERQVEVKGL